MIAQGRMDSDRPRSPLPANPVGVVSGCALDRAPPFAF